MRGDKSTNLLDVAAFAPEDVKALGKAFDEAWAGVSSAVTSVNVEDARVILAQAILTHASQLGLSDFAAVKAAALQTFSKHYPPAIPVVP